MSGPRHLTMGGALSGDILDDDGNLLLGTGLTAQSGGLGPAIRRYITSGVYNGDFFLQPPSDGAISAENPLPFWTWTVVSGTAVQATNEADSAQASGRKITLTMAAGAAGDEAYIEQIVPVNGSRAQSYGYFPVGTWRTGATVNSIEVFVGAQYLLADGVTTTGTADERTATTTSIGANTTSELFLEGPFAVNGFGQVPSDAYYLRIRYGIQRGAAATTDSVTVALTEARVLSGTDTLYIVDTASPGTYGPLTLYQAGGVASILPDFAAGPSFTMDTTTGIMTLTPNGSGYVKLAAANTGWLEMSEVTAPAAPAANTCRLFVRDNGSGKTQLCARFPTGAIQVIATEP